MKLFQTFAFLLLMHTLSGQSVSQQKMDSLHFMVGQWVGISTSIKDGKVVSEIPAFQSIKYALNKHAILIDLKSESLQLHTVIRYDEKDKTYYYNPFSERGARKLPADFENGKFIVRASDTKRFIFERTGPNSFREYGENFENGKWVKYFEDKFKDIP